jgi:hypothetical protein
MMLWLEKRKLWLGKRPLVRFTVAVLALLPACFAVWYVWGAYFALPSLLIAKPVLLAWLGESIASVTLQGTDMTVLLRYGESNGAILPAQVAGNQIGHSINTRILSYSIPFYLALYFATPLRSGWTGFLWCLMALCLLIAIGLVVTELKNLAFGLPPELLASAAFPPTDAIALAYQFSTLMVPPLAPVLLWAYTAMDSPAFLALLPESFRPAQASEPRI